MADLVITRGIMANWGAQGPAGDRFYAFDKKNGRTGVVIQPGDRPKDNSFSLRTLACSTASAYSTPPVGRQRRMCECANG